MSAIRTWAVWAIKAIKAFKAISGQSEQPRHFGSTKDNSFQFLYAKLEIFQDLRNLVFWRSSPIYVSYPETGGKSLEEVDGMFRNGGPKPWKTRLGQSHLDERTVSVAAEQRRSSLDNDGDIAHMVKKDGTIWVIDKNEAEKADSRTERARELGF